MAGSPGTERLRRLRELRERTEREAGFNSPVWVTIDDNFDTLAAIVAVVGLFLASGPIGWVVAGAGAGVSLYDRMIRKPRKARMERERQQDLDITNHQIDKLIEDEESSKNQY